MAGTLKIIVTADTTRAETDLKRLKSAIDQPRDALGRFTRQAETDAGRIGRSFKSAADTATSSVNLLRGAFAGLAALGIANLLKSVGDAALKSAIDIDKTRQTLIALTGSVEAANKKLADLRQLAASSVGVTSSFASQIFAQLKVVGTITDQTIEKVIKSIGKLNAVFTLDSPSLFVTNLQQIFDQGFELSDIKQAIGRVPIFNQLLEQAFGTKDPEKLRKLKEAGTLTAETFLAGFSKAIEQRFPAVNESLGAKLAKAKDNILVALAPLGDEIGKVLLPLLNDLGEAVRNYGPIAAKAFGDNKAEIIEVGRELGKLVVDIGRLIVKIGELGQQLGFFKSFKEEIRQTALILATARDLVSGDFSGTRTRTLAEKFFNQDVQEGRRNRVVGPGGITQGRISDLFNEVVLGPPITKNATGTSSGADTDAGSGATARAAREAARKRAEEIKDLLKDINKQREEIGKDIVDDLNAVNEELRKAILSDTGFGFGIDASLDRNKNLRETLIVDADLRRRQSEAVTQKTIKEIQEKQKQLRLEADQAAFGESSRIAGRNFSLFETGIGDAISRGQIDPAQADELRRQAAAAYADQIEKLLAIRRQMNGVNQAEIDQLTDQIDTYRRLGSAVSDTDRFFRGFKSGIESTGDAFERLGQNVSAALSSVTNIFSGLKNAVLGFFRDLLGQSLQRLVANSLQGVVGGITGPLARLGIAVPGAQRASGVAGSIGALGGLFNVGFGTPPFNPNASGATGIFANGAFAAGLAGIGGGGGGSLARGTGFGSILPTDKLSGFLQNFGFGNPSGTAIGALGSLAPLLGAGLGAGLGGSSVLGQILGAGGGLATGIGLSFGASVLGAGGGLGQAALAALGPIALIGVPLLIGAFFLGKASQRKRDEEASGAFLTQALERIRELRRQVDTDQLDGSQAKAVFENQILGDFIQQINTLKTESVRKSRLTNQVRDLRAVFDAELTPAIASQKQRKRVNQNLIPEFATGGLVPGVNRGFDSVLAMLTPGEIVLNQAQQGAIAAMAGAGVFSRAGVPDAGIPTGAAQAFQFGGRVADSLPTTIMLDVQVGMSQSGAEELFAVGASSDSGHRVIVSNVRSAQKRREL